MYSKKDLSFVFSMGEGDFDGIGTDKITLGNLKAAVKLGAYGNVSGFTAEVVIYGLGLRLLSMLSAKGTFGAMEDNPGAVTVEIFTGKTKLFKGGIYASYGNMNSLPEPALMLNAVAGLSVRTNEAKAFSLSGPVNIADMLGAIAKAAGLGSRIVSVTKVVNDPHYTGSAMQQISTICQDNELSYQVIDDVLVVWPFNGLSDDVVPLVSPEQGLIGYPVFTQGGITFQTQFSPLLSSGRAVELQTSLPNAPGRYILTVVEHMLTTWTEGGSWHTLCQGYRITT
ncbi:baseplate hub protein [Serratia proteamaculans]|uniref:baseplate hub protein n=1 Tax=Serratia proteamaculans TaxID=28151 RepID=UPI002177B106|nr:hypothetical protein [Serratia proteamaculans]CAI1172227.1 Uncharacterised protein [Serratia proteamaculans]